MPNGTDEGHKGVVIELVSVKRDPIVCGKYAVWSVWSDDKHEIEADGLTLADAVRRAGEVKVIYDAPDVPISYAALSAEEKGYAMLTTLRVELGAEGQPFTDWQRKVDACVQQRAGVSLADLPDVPLRDWFDAGVLPHVAAADALREAGWGEGDDDETFDKGGDNA